MKNTSSQFARNTILAILFVLLAAREIFAQSTGFTYQSRLTDSSFPVNGSYDFQFKLFDALTGGNQIGITQLNGIQVTNGVFNVTLDFGANAFPGAARFLDISVRLAGNPSFTALTPRRAINSVPYAVKSLSAASADALSSTCVACVADAQIAAVAGSNRNDSGGGRAGYSGELHQEHDDGAEQREFQYQWQWHGGRYVQR